MNTIDGVKKLKAENIVLRERIDELEANIAVTDIEAQDLRVVLISKDIIKESDLTAAREAEEVT